MGYTVKELLESKERLKAYDPELPKDMEPMVYVNYCEKSELGNPRCAKNSRKI